MSDRITWYGQNQLVVLQTFEGRTTWESFICIATKSAQMLQSVEHPVQVIVDRTHAHFANFQPSKLQPIEDDIVPDNQDIVIVIGADYMLRALSSIVGAEVAPKAFEGSYYVETLQEAHDILKRERGIDL